MRGRSRLVYQSSYLPKQGIFKQLSGSEMREAKRAFAAGHVMAMPLGPLVVIAILIVILIVMAQRRLYKPGASLLKPGAGFIKQAPGHYYHYCCY